MPAETEITIARTSRVEQVSCELHADDEATLLGNAGVFPVEYVTQSRINAMCRATDTNGRLVNLSISVQEDENQSPADRTAIRETVLEFFTMPKGHALIGQIFRGEIPDGPGVFGGARWRKVNDGMTYNMHDGTGTFEVVADE